MMSARKEPFGRDDRADGQGAEPAENQLELFEILSRAGAGTVQPSGNEDAGPHAVDMELGKMEPAIAGAVGLGAVAPGVVAPGVVGPGVVGLGAVEPIASPAATRDFLEVGRSESDDLRRLEESIRWLANAGTMTLSLPRAAPLPPVIGLPPVVAREDDSLLLDPDTLFPPHAPRRRSGIAAGAAKIMLVSAVAAPTAYFIASWSQFRDAAAPSDPTAFSAVATAVALSGEQVAVLEPVPVPSGPALQAARKSDEISIAPQPEPTLSRAVDVAPAAATGPNAAPEQPPGGAAAPADAASPPIPVVMPVRPSLRPEEIAMLIHRGRVLFEAGDVAAARLFFRRAANAGDPAAATAMGSTYDPEVLAQRFIRGIDPDAREAQKWYEKAREMETRVEMLAHNR